MTAPPVFEAESTLTDRYQTTVPEPVRLALKLGKRDKLRYALRPDGSVLMTRAPQADEEDPVLEQFLDFMARDLASHPERVHSIDGGLIERIRALVGQVEIDLDAPLSPDDE
jgi:antitoxin PrlF